MTSEISNNISIGTSPLISNKVATTDHAKTHLQDVTKTDLDYSRQVTSTQIASQSATHLGGQRKDGVQLSPKRSEKAFEEEHDTEDDFNNDKDKEKIKEKFDELCEHHLLDLNV